MTTNIIDLDRFFRNTMVQDDVGRSLWLQRKPSWGPHYSLTQGPNEEFPLKKMSFPRPNHKKRTNGRGNMVLIFFSEGKKPPDR